MTDRTTKILFLLTIIAWACAMPAAATLTSISQGNVVFIGEEGLDITAAMGPTDTRIGWWASAADISNSAPTKTIEVSTRLTNFMVAPSDFIGYTGGWYRIDSAGNADGSAFTVADPQLAMTVEDTTTSVNFDALHWIPTGDDIRFRIDTNIAQMTTERGVAPTVALKVRSPDGAMYSALSDSAGTLTPISDIAVTTSPFYTGSIWNMGNPDQYPPGTYTLWAECNVNHMKDNYGVTGKTISSQFSLLNQGVNPLIRTYTSQTTVMTTAPTPVITTILPTPTTVATTPPTTVVTEVPTTIVPPTETTVPQTPIPTKTPGFEALLAGAALLIGLAACGRKE